ncbi:uncharacterized protein LOC131166529 isoform X2 [Malania oleifera]|uniref:uncharacterized protein LOC131166529 isoform X2 n=1 Tax=Malania oleifera TaxID=397392 RepID=UPI0025AE6470|nr:uncharacterized protein LOC131166529 isoform X2 [Malania oleifera]
MPIEMPGGLPFSVDTWTPSSMRKRHHFITHAHKDHSTGISTHFAYPIYSTPLTKALLLQHYPQLDDSLFVDIKVGQSLAVDDPDGNFSFTVFDANHCPGAVMFLFEGNFGSILHTGDCRLTSECLLSLPEKYIGTKGKVPAHRLDYVFLDCTFGRFPLELPSKLSAIQQVINCIWNHPNAPVVYLACDLLGQEEILLQVSQTFGSKIFVDKANSPDSFQSFMLTVPEILAHDPSPRFQLFEGFPKLYERARAKIAEAQANFQPEPLIIRPSAQWYACDEELSGVGRVRKQRYSEAVRDQFGVWHVCYSMHSSREELEWALQLLAPKWVVSTTPSCRAMELDYVKKHCFRTKITSNDPIWKLLDINTEVPLFATGEGGSPVVEISWQTPAETQLQMKKISNSCREVLCLSPNERFPLTLFGRARHGLPDIPVFEENKISSVHEDISQITLNAVGPKSQYQKNIAFKDQCKKLLESTTKISVEVESENSMETESVVRESVSCSPLVSSKNFSKSFRKLYRSMNVPVPQPLPSLVELMKANKRPKRRFEF